VALVAELPFQFENKIAVLLLTEQPRTSRLAAVKHPLFHLPYHASIRGLAHVVPLPHYPAFGNAVLRKQGDEARFLFCCPRGHGGQQQEQSEANNTCSHTRIPRPVVGSVKGIAR